MSENTLVSLYRWEVKYSDEAEQAIRRRAGARKSAGIALRQERTRQGVALRQMARAIGCSAAMLSDMETGRRWSDTLFHCACIELGCVPRDSSGRGR